MTALITASYHRDFEACRLLCETIDAYVTGHTMHYIVVASEDVALFRPLAGPRRLVVDAATLLPRMTALPLSWRGRRYSWMPGMRGPIYGWHLQQLRKIAMTLALSEPKAMHIDSDNCFVRPFDVGALVRTRTPLRRDVDAIDGASPSHALWWKNAHTLLGLEAPALPGDDYVGPLIVWERAAVSAMVARIESTTGKPWWLALAALRDFSEYMIYGVMVANDPRLMERHEFTSESPCLAYWDGPPLDAQSLAAFTAELGPRQVAIAVQSFTGTPSAVIRDFALGREAVA
jgi:hypothetical protein